MNILQRGPNGRFLGYEEAIPVWLPVLLNGCGLYPVEAMFETMANYCAQLAANFYRQAGVDLLQNLSGKPTWALQKAELAIRQRDFLLDCAKRWRELQ